VVEALQVGVSAKRETHSKEAMQLLRDQSKDVGRFSYTNRPTRLTEDVILQPLSINLDTLESFEYKASLLLLNAKSFKVVGEAKSFNLAINSEDRKLSVRTYFTQMNELRKSARDRLLPVGSIDSMSLTLHPLSYEICAAHNFVFVERREMNINSKIARLVGSDNITKFVDLVSQPSKRKYASLYAQSMSGLIPDEAALESVLNAINTSVSLGTKDLILTGLSPRRSLGVLLHTGHDFENNPVRFAQQSIQLSMGASYMYLEDSLSQDTQHDWFKEMIN
jgi:hypothetical protein